MNHNHSFSIFYIHTSAIALPGIFTSLIPLLLIILSSSEAASNPDACNLTMDGTLGSMRGWFWSSLSSTSCSQQSDCVKNVECCHGGKCTWVDWVAPLISIVLLLVGFSFLMCIISCFCPANLFSCVCDCSGRKNQASKA